MTVDELLALSEGDGVLILVLQRLPTGERMRLCGKHGPFGEVLCVGQDGTVVRFQKKAIRAYLRKQLKGGS